MEHVGEGEPVKSPKQEVATEKYSAEHHKLKVESPKSYQQNYYAEPYGQTASSRLFICGVNPFVLAFISVALYVIDRATLTAHFPTLSGSYTFWNA